MAKNGHNVCSWEEWESLDKTQQEREIYRVLKVIDARTQGIEQVIKYYAFGGGIIGGAIAVFTVFGIKITLGL